MARYMAVPERMMLAGLSEGEAMVKRKRIAACITEKSTPFKWLRMRISAQRAPGSVAAAPCNAPERAARFIIGAYPEIIDAYAEHVVVLCLDTNLIPVALYPVHVGARGQSLVDPKSVLVGVIMATPSTRFILAHNHPSGSLKFSQDDVDVFQRMKQAAEMVGLRCDDFLIITETHVAALSSGDVAAHGA